MNSCIFYKERVVDLTLSVLLFQEWTESSFCILILIEKCTDFKSLASDLNTTGVTACISLNLHDTTEIKTQQLF